MKIDYKGLAGNYKSIKVSIDDINSFCSIDEYINLNVNCFEIRTVFYDIHLYSYNNYHNDIKYLKIKNDGIFYDIQPVLKKFYTIFGIKGDVTSSIKIKVGKISQIENPNQIKSISKYLYREYKMMESDSNLNETLIKRYRNIQKQRDRMILELDKMHLLKDEYAKKYSELNKKYPITNIDDYLEKELLNIFKDRCNNNLTNLLHAAHNNYKYVSILSGDDFIIIDSDKLKLLVANSIKDYASKNSNNENIVKDALDYLKTFLIENRELVDSDYKISKNKINTNSVTNQKTIFCSDIIAFINTITGAKLEEDKQPLKSNYLSFEIDESCNSNINKSKKLVKYNGLK